MLALDLDRKCGWASCPPDWQPSVFPDPARYACVRHGTRLLAKPKVEQGGVFLALHHWLPAAFKECEPSIVAVEGKFIPPQQRASGAMLGPGLMAILVMHCYHRNLRLVSFMPRSIKKHWTGDGSAKKPAMIEKCQTQGLDPCDDNAADAIALLDLAVARLMLEGSWGSQHER